MKKKLPVLSTPTPAKAQTELTAKPVVSGSRPEFPKRNDLYRKAGLFGSSAVVILAGSLAAADAPAKKMPPANPPAPQKQPQPVEEPTPPPAVDPALLKNGAIDGAPIDLKKAPTFKVYREGGGIGPAEDMWEPKEVEAFINWNMAKEGKLQLQTNFKFEYSGVSLELKGYDPEHKVGYAYIDKLESDDAFTKEVQTKLAAWQKAKKVAILFIEVKKTPDQATLKGKIVRFLADVKKAPMTPGELK